LTIVVWPARVIATNVDITMSGLMLRMQAVDVTQWHQLFDAAVARAHAV